jgi:hypothetical protein
VSVKGHSLPPVLYVLGDESGSFKHGDWMVVGIVLLSDPESARADLAALRTRHRFTNELKYGSTDKYRMPFALAVLEWFFTNPDIEFRCIAKNGDLHDPSYYASGWSELDPDILAYNMTYKEVIKFNLPADPRRVLVKVDEKSRHRMDNLLQYLPYAIPSIRRVFEGNSKDDDLLQVVDLLVGCVHGDLTGVADPLKRALTDDFTRRCGTKSVLQRPTKCTNLKVNVWRWNPTRAKKRAAGPS